MSDSQIKSKIQAGERNDVTVSYWILADDLFRKRTKKDNKQPKEE